MAASAWKVYNTAKKYFTNGTIDLDTTALHMKLVKGGGATSVSNLARSTFASAGTALTFNGAVTFHTLAACSLRMSSNSVLVFDCTAEVFTASASQTSILYAVIGVNGGKAIAWSKLTSSGTITVGGSSTLTVTPAAAGVFTISGGTS